MWGSEGQQKIQHVSKAICDAIHASAKEIQPNCMVGKVMGFDSDTAGTWEDPFLSDDEFVEEYDWREDDQKFTKVIWAQFGRFAVQYNLNPCKEKVLKASGETFNEGQMTLLVYAKPDEKSKSIFLAKNEISWKRDVNYECFSDYKNQFIQHGKVENTEENVILGLALCLVADLGNLWPVDFVESNASYVYYRHLTFVPSTALENVHSALSLSGIRTKKVQRRVYRDLEKFERDYFVHIDLHP